MILPYAFYIQITTPITTNQQEKNESTSSTSSTTTVINQIEITNTIHNILVRNQQYTISTESI
jgi:hypothetical protein